MLFWAVVLGLLLGVGYVAYKTKDDPLERGLAPFITAMMGSMVLGLMMVIIFAVIVRSNPTPTRTETWHLELVALKNIDSFQGSFFLASGRIGSSEVYVYMYRMKNGDLRRARDNAYRSTVRETDDESPRRKYDKRFLRVEWFIPWEIKLKDSMPCFVVPPGTVVSLDKYEID